MPKRAIGIAFCTLEIGQGGDLQVFPAGRFRANDGRPDDAPAWITDQAIAKRVIAAAAARKNDIVVDYEHQTLHTEKNGQPAPAAGWIKPRTFEWRDGHGLFAGVAWNGKAREQIAAGEYKYFSPVFAYRVGTGEVLALLHGAVTNNPALEGMDQLTARAAARFNITQESDMLEKILKLLGLEADATEEKVESAVTALKAKAKPPADLVKKLELEEGAEFPAVIEAVDELQASVAAAKASNGDVDPSKFVPVSTMKAVQGEVAALRAQLNEREVNELLDPALDPKRDGTLSPAQESWARDLGKKDIAALKAYLKNAPRVVPKDRQTQGKKAADADQVELSEASIAVGKMFGNSEEDLKKVAAAGD